LHEPAGDRHGGSDEEGDGVTEDVTENVRKFAALHDLDPQYAFLRGCMSVVEAWDLDPRDIDVLRVTALYFAAMALIARRTWDGYDDFDHYMMLYVGLVSREPDRELPDDEMAISTALFDLATQKEFEWRHKHVAKRIKRRRRKRQHGVVMCGLVMGRRMRLDDRHVMAAWLVEQLRRLWCESNREQRCPDYEVGAIIQRALDVTEEKFGVPLDPEHIREIMKLKKARRFTDITYF
jgi:hypothetical protein